MRPVGALARAALGADAAVVTGLNAAVRDSGVRQRLTAWAAGGLAGVEVVLMLGLACGGGKWAAARMVAAVGLVYVFSEALGALWPRMRPFAHTDLDIQALVAHSPQRSFPSRHVASGVAMAAIGERAHSRLGAAMRITAGLLGISRVAAGVHYPSDVLAGALLGRLIGRLLG
jgi:undecaprenyl-diphosphatase